MARPAPGAIRRRGAHRAGVSRLGDGGGLCAGGGGRSKRLPAKAHAAWEPVLPPQRRRTVCVLGASAFGQTIRQAAHRPALYAALAGASGEDVITPALAARVLMAEGGFDVIWVKTKSIGGLRPGAGRVFAQAVDCPVVVGSLRRKRWKRLR